MVRKRVQKNWTVLSTLLIAIAVYIVFAILYDIDDKWLAFSSLATLLLALAAFWAIWENRRMRKEDREEKRSASSADELCRWAEEALRLYYLPYNYNKDEIKNGLSVLVIKNMLVITLATIIGNEFTEPTKRVSKALAEYYGLIKDKYYNKKVTGDNEDILKEFEDAFYTLLSYLYVLRICDYSYSRFLDDAVENGVLKPKYILHK